MSGRRQGGAIEKSCEVCGQACKDAPAYFEHLIYRHGPGRLFDALHPRPRPDPVPSPQTRRRRKLKPSKRTTRRLSSETRRLLGVHETARIERMGGEDAGLFHILDHRRYRGLDEREIGEADPVIRTRKSENLDRKYLVPFPADDPHGCECGACRRKRDMAADPYAADFDDQHDWTPEDRALAHLDGTELHACVLAVGVDLLADAVRAWAEDLTLSSKGEGQRFPVGVAA